MNGTGTVPEYGYHPPVRVLRGERVSRAAESAAPPGLTLPHPRPVSPSLPQVLSVLYILPKRKRANTIRWWLYNWESITVTVSVIKYFESP